MAGPSVLAQLKFEKADFYVSNNTAFNSSLNMAQRVALYAFRQQAIVGKCNTPKPGFFELVEEVKKRWHAWNNLGSMSHDDAVSGFMGVIDEIEPRWEEWPGFPTPGEDDLTEEHLKEATTKIQTHFRKFSAQKTVEQDRADADAASRIQSVIRGKSARGVAVQKRAEAAKQREQDEERAKAEQEELKAFWHLLLQGMCVMKYSMKSGKKAERHLWLDRTGTRLYIARKKVVDTSASTKGLYLRDISEIRAGTDSNTFAQLKSQGVAPSPDKCFSLIGTERTIDVEMPTANSCANVVARFQLLLKALTTSTSKAAKGKWGRAIAQVRKSSMADVAIVAHFRELLLTGMEVIKYDGNGKRKKKVLWLDKDGDRLYIDAKKRIVSTGTEKGLSLNDITEIRPGINSAAFSKAACDGSSKSKCFSIIGSERTLDIELPTSEARDAVVFRLQLFMHQWHHKDQSVHSAFRPPESAAREAPLGLGPP